MRARSSRAPGPVKTTKPPVLILVPTSKSKSPSRVPISTWSFGAKAKAGFDPHSRTTGWRLVAADGTGGMGQVRDLEEEAGLAGLGRVGFLADGLDALADATDGGLELGAVLALLLHRPDLLREAVPLALEGLLLGLAGAAAFVARENLVDKAPGLPVAVLEAGLDSFGVFAELADVEHGAGIVTQHRDPTRLGGDHLRSRSAISASSVARSFKRRSKAEFRVRALIGEVI